MRGGRCSANSGDHGDHGEAQEAEADEGPRTFRRPVVRNAYESLAKGDLDGALADLADDCVFHFGGDGPNSGDHKGREAITAALIKDFELTAGTQALDIKGIYADDNHAAVVLHETASRPDGASIAVDEVHAVEWSA